MKRFAFLFCFGFFLSEGIQAAPQLSEEQLTWIKKVVSREHSIVGMSAEQWGAFFKEIGPVIGQDKTILGLSMMGATSVKVEVEIPKSDTICIFIFEKKEGKWTKILESIARY